MNISKLKQDLANKKISQRAAADMLGMQLGSYQHFLKSDDCSVSVLERVCTAFNLSLADYLDIALPITNTSRSKVYHLPNDVSAGDVISLDQYMGEVEEWYMPRIGIEGGTLYSFTVKGNSMEPTLRNGDLLVCNEPITAISALQNNALYVVAYADGIKVKRVIRTSTGVRLVSDNPTYRDELVTEGHFAALRVRHRITDVSEWH